MSVLSQPRPYAGIAARPALARAALVVPACLLLCFIAEAALFVPLAYLNRDEGWYLLAGRLAYHGQVPYRDFPYFQTPLGPYVFGVAGSFASSPIIGGRILASALGLTSVALVMHLGRRVGGLACGALAAVVLLASPDFIVASTTARTEAIVMPLLLLAVWAVLERPRGLAGFVVAPALLLLAASARLSFLPAFGAAVALCYWNARPTRRELVAGLALLGLLAVLANLPALLSPPSRTFFDVWTAQGARNAQFNATPTALYETVAQRIAFLKTPGQTFFIVLVPLLLVAIHAAHRWRGRWRPSAFGVGRDPIANQLVLALFAIVAWLPFAGFGHQEARYFVPSFTLLAIATADVFVRSWRGTLGEAMRYAAPMIAVLFAAFVIFQASNLPDVLDTADVRQNDQVGQYVRSISGPDGRLVALNPALALAAARPLPSALVMGQFSMWPKFSTGRAAGDGVLNVDLLEREMLDARTQVIALDDYDLSLIATFRGEDPTAPPDAPWPLKLFPSLAPRYELASTVADFGQFADTLYILRRRD